MSFAHGQRVRVAARRHDGHHRTPTYLKGHVGTVERLQGRYTNPETRASGDTGLPQKELYLVAFDQSELWPGYGRGDRLYVDIFEHWLEDE